MIVSSRGEAAQISSTLMRPRVVSIWASMPTLAARPVVVSIWVSSMSRACTSAALCTLGSISSSSRSEAFSTMWMTSRYVHLVSQALTRTQRTLSPQSPSLMALTALSRAASFSRGATESSRSRKTMSAARPWALSSIFSLEAGTARQERRGRWRLRSDMFSKVSVPIRYQGIVRTVDSDVCVVGGGPAGMMLAVLLVRQGLSGSVLEQHADFLRDFRGGTIHASTLNLMDELGWGDEFLRLPHQKARTLSGVFGDREYTFGDCARLPGKHQYIALMPQWDFLDFLAGKAAEYEGFTLLRSTPVDGLLRHGRGGRVAGVSAAGPDGRVEVRARATVACDGRHSDVRRLLGLEPRAY